MMAATRAAFQRDDLAGLKSDAVLEAVRPALVADGWSIESGKTRAGRIRVGWFEVDGWHAERRAILEVEGGRATESNAVYRDILRTMTLDEIWYPVLAVPIAYRHKNGVAKSYDLTMKLCRHLHGRLPFEVVVIGY